MISSKTIGFVFVHGAWHDQHTWDAVLPLLHAQGYTAQAFDLPGAGSKEGRPASFYRRPLDPVAFATEPSPVAGVTQDERNAVLLTKIDEMATQTGGGKVIVVAHSFGGLSLVPMTEAYPEKIAVAVYLTAFMLPSGKSAVALMQSPVMADSRVPTLFMANPAVVGALRVDVASTDPKYRMKLRTTFYNDLDDANFEHVLTHLHPDEPVSVSIVPSAITTGRFGTVPRHYIRCTEDRVVPPAAQDQMIDWVDAEVGSKTQLHTLNTSHSPFYSDPKGVTDILVKIAREQTQPNV